MSTISSPWWRRVNMKSLAKNLKKFEKAFPMEWDYQIDLLILYGKQDKKKEFDKGKEQLNVKIQDNQLFTETSARHMIERKEYDWAEETYLTSRAAIGNPTIYAQNLIALYQFSGSKLKMGG